MGKKYFEAIPKIYIDKRDAVLSIFRNSKKMYLRDIGFNCFFDSGTADIILEPLGEKRPPEFVKLTVCNFRPCSFIQNLSASKKFIDIGKTASSLAHGLRNPLNAIKGAIIYICEKYKNDQSLVEFLKIMNEEISRLDNFISKFLSSSLSDSELIQMNINDVLKKIELYISYQTRSHNIKTFYEYGKIPDLILNQFQIEQAILNIINNAIEAMPWGGNLYIRTYLREDVSSNYVVIEIVDTGMGFQDKHDCLPSNESGRGYGLFITREIIKSHGGFIEINSFKGQGTSVKIYLPTKNLRFEVSK
ncbi:MAG: HAMP domain-containing histidine kinase [Thermodesulfovibrionales bacterium]|nr:HAMP domain-containing histidine kinase [Thermodesulfovibrionales bacterium]